MIKQNELIDTSNSIVVTRGKGVGKDEASKGVKCMVTEGE